MRRLRFLIPLLALLLAIGWTAHQRLFGDLPDVDALEARRARPTTRIYDRKGHLLYEVIDPQAGKQLDLPLDPEGSRYGVARVPDFCVEAVLATEDRRFFQHPGVDPLAILRAAYQNLRAQRVVSGASTLTMQVARNLLLDPEERYQRTLVRKLREAYLALAIEQRYTKEQILQIYLNQSYFGHLAFGLEAAAQTFFAKPAEQLSPGECALLIGLIQYPTGYDPFVAPDAARQRQRTVLALMARAGFITAQEAERIGQEPLRFASGTFPIRAPHFVVDVQEELVSRLGVDRLRDGGLDVVTTLDLDLQRQAERALRHRLAQLTCRADETAHLLRCPPEAVPGRRVDNAAAVVLDVATGDVLALVGSPDYFDARIQGSVNAARALRQPGSAMKPFTYALALDPGWSRRRGLPPLTPASILPDVPTAFPDPGPGDQEADRVYVPVNYDRRYHGPVSVREALANSYNIPAVAVLHRVGVRALQQLAAQAGITSLDGDYGLALTLGGGEVSLLELTAAYGIFPRQGRPLPPRRILRITDRITGEVLVDHTEPPEPGPPVIAPATAYLITHILADPVARIPAFGEGSPLDLPFPAAVKTGTTTDWRDNWTIGYSTRRLVGVWVGNADNTPMEGISGVDGAAPIWRDLMLLAHPEPPPPFPRPRDVVTRTVCAASGLLPTLYCPHTREEIFIRGTEPTRPDDQFQPIAIDRATGYRATETTPPEQVEERVYWMPGPQYTAWLRANGIPEPPPPRPQAPSSHTDAPSADPGTGALVLAAPLPGSVYLRDPSLPMEVQRILVEGYTQDGRPWARLRLRVDGTIWAEVRNADRLRAWWPLVPGAHTFQIEGQPSEDGPLQVGSVIRIVVE